MRLEGKAATDLYGVCDCQRATLLNQVWLLKEPDFAKPGPDGQHVFTRFIFCGLCGGLRHETGD